MHTSPKHPRGIWAQVFDGPPPSNTAHPAQPRPRRKQPRTPAPTPELNATQKWLAAFMGDRAFARARAAGKNETEAGHARAKAKSSQGLLFSEAKKPHAEAVGQTGAQGSPLPPGLSKESGER